MSWAIVGSGIAGLAVAHTLRGRADITLFDSTGLAIQDLALCHALMEAHSAGVLGARTVAL